MHIFPLVNGQKEYYYYYYKHRSLYVVAGYMYIYILAMFRKNMQVPLILLFIN